jgi:hypothetical protein
MEEKKTYAQLYYAKNRERLLAYVKEKTECECGAVVTRLKMAAHKRSNRHANRMRHNKFLEKQKETS